MTTGEPTPLLLIPGLLCDDVVWQPQIAALAGIADCTVARNGATDSITRMAEQALALMPPGPFAVAGHSMGGRVALEIVRLAPERVSRLALLDTGYQAIAPGLPGQGERNGRMQLLEVARTQGMRAMGERWARGMVHPDVVGTPLFEAVLDMLERATPDLFEAQIHALLGRPDATPLLPHIRVPTLVLCGREDGWSPLARHETMRDLIGDVARLAVVEHCGHMSTMEQPGVVSGWMARWLGGDDVTAG
ncbi:MAG: alpha/beta hydrolase [Burkholderiales bacterium]|nr:alpha/beta hydrolase [Burkholderiales bacterium]